MSIQIFCDGATAPNGFEFLIANGGLQAHLVQSAGLVAESPAMCGYAPSSRNAGRKMKPRGRWAKYPNEWSKACRACVAAAAKGQTP